MRDRLVPEEAALFVELVPALAAVVDPDQESNGDATEKHKKGKRAPKKEVGKKAAVLNGVEDSEEVEYEDEQVFVRIQF